MWIKSDKGNLANLANATEVRSVNTTEGKLPHVVRVFFPGGGESADWTDVAKYATKEEAAAHVQKLAEQLGAK